MLITVFYALVFATNTIIFNPYLESNINYYENDIKNTILIIGDGMGEAHVTAASVYADRALSFEAMEHTGYVNTLSYSGITDSAAAATAMATGYKTKNGAISRYNGEDLITTIEIAKNNNKKTGVITSDVLSGATPAVFSAHATNRGDTSDIINSQINSQIDLLIGEGKSTYSQYTNNITEAGYQHIIDKNSLNITSSKVFATLPAIEPTETAIDNSINMSNLTDFALNFLENDNGFLLIIEVSDIDKRSHSNNLESMIYEMLMWDSVASTVLSWVENRQDTLVLLTADHETGGLTLDKTDNYENLLATYSFKTTRHTDVFVPFYSLGYNLNEDYIDNVDIFKLLNFIITKTPPS